MPSLIQAGNCFRLCASRTGTEGVGTSGTSVTTAGEGKWGSAEAAGVIIVTFVGTFTLLYLLLWGLISVCVILLTAMLVQKAGGWLKSFDDCELLL